MTGKYRGFGNALKAVLRLAKKAHIQPILIGAGALAVYGEERYTDDIDVLVSHEDSYTLVKQMKMSDWGGPHPSRDLYYYSMETPSGVEVDVLGGTEQLYEDAQSNIRIGTYLGNKVKVPRTEFFVLLKLRAALDNKERRLKHLADIESLLKVQPKTNMRFVKDYLTRYESELASMWKLFFQITL